MARVHLGTTTILKGSNQLARKLATGWHPVATIILKGWNQSAQGCEERATLGLPPRTPATLKGLYQIVRPVPVVVSSAPPVAHGPKSVRLDDENLVFILLMQIESLKV